MLIGGTAEEDGGAAISSSVGGAEIFPSPGCSETRCSPIRDKSNCIPLRGTMSFALSRITPTSIVLVTSINWSHPHIGTLAFLHRKKFKPKMVVWSSPEVNLGYQTLRIIYLMPFHQRSKNHHTIWSHYVIYHHGGQSGSNNRPPELSCKTKSHLFYRQSHVTDPLSAHPFINNVTCYSMQQGLSLLSVTHAALFCSTLIRSHIKLY